MRCCRLGPHPVRHSGLPVGLPGPPLLPADDLHAVADVLGEADPRQQQEDQQEEGELAGLHPLDHELVGTMVQW